jgi:LEA14-like dessication related protein
MKKIIVIVLVFATILNIIGGAFLFLDIQVMSVPETTLRLELINITSDVAVLQITISVNNQNSFAISLQNLTIHTVTDTGDVINHLVIDGGEIKADENKTFSQTTSVRFNGSTPHELTSRVTGIFGIAFFGLIKKTLPLKFSMVTTLTNIIEQFSLPIIQMAMNFSEITEERVNITGIIEVTNPNTIDIAIENFSMTIDTNTGMQVGTVSIQGNIIPGKTTAQLTGMGSMLLKALDAKTLHLALQAEVLVVIAGMKKTMNLTIGTEITPPHLESLLSDLPTDVSLTGIYTYSLRGGVHDQIIFEIKNPNKLTFRATDITVQISRIDRNTTRLLCTSTLPDSVITPQNTTVLQGDMVIPLSELWPRVGERLFADRLEVMLRANITLPGLNQTMWIGVIVYQDFPFHRLFL